MATDNAIARRYEMLRQRAATQANAQTQEEQDLLKRKFASQGMLNSGAAIKQQTLATDRGAQRLQAANEAIDTQQMGEEERLAEAERGREFTAGQNELQRKFMTSERLGGQEFSRSERLGGQGFTAGQNVLQRQFQTGERVAGQTWQSGENAAQRTFATSEREAGQTFASGQADLQREWQGKQNRAQLMQNERLARKEMEFKESMFTFQQSDANRKFDLAMKQYGLEELVTKTNLELADTLANRPTIFDRFGSWINDSFDAKKRWSGES